MIQALAREILKNRGFPLQRTSRFRSAIAATAFALWLANAAVAQTTVLQVDKTQTTAQITLPATLHTVHGKFLLDRGVVRFDQASAKISGEIVFDATSGKTGNEGRDRKMHKDVLESGKFSQISFRPDRIEGKVSPSGTSTAQVHGIFTLHGTEHELTVPVEVKFEANRWQATARFQVPYEKWGLKNPSTLFLHVDDSVNVEFHGEGTIDIPAPQ